MSVFEQKNSDALVVAGGNGSVLEVRVQVGGQGWHDITRPGKPTP